ncbi:MAG: hypothetical protein B6245_12515 [Desulfobacteraceae bacterium 4572_88]|nr:MAG: hypothetical protein B6245_12515 [Desulfobacteraceae bacterium 4572_88]
MGVDAVAIVENTRNISLEEFLGHMGEDERERTRDLDDCYNEPKAWTEFEWEGRCYFSMTWVPRYFRLFEKMYDFESDEYHENPYFNRVIQVSFLRRILFAEKFAGGPVFLGNDAVCGGEPPEDPEHDNYFFIPSKLDDMIDDWRGIAESDADRSNPC